MIFYPEQYEVFPAVYQVGKETKVRILPMQAQCFFEEDKEYSVIVFSMTEDVISHHEVTFEKIPVKAQEGMLIFPYTFSVESEHTIEVYEGSSCLVKLDVYAVAQDLYKKVPMRGDLHVHSHRSDGTVEPAMVAAYYREFGFDFISLNDHNRYFSSKEMKEAYEGVSLGMTLLNGEEVHTPGTNLHIVHVGGKESVDERYVKAPQQFAKEVSEIEAEMDFYPEQYRHRMALAKWTTDNIHSAGGIAIFAHPYWKPKAFNTTDEFNALLFESAWFDAFEVYGGGDNAGNTFQELLWQDVKTNGNDIPVVGSSDSHAFTGNSFNTHYTIVFSDSTKEDDILQAIRDGYTVAAKAEVADASRVTCCGELRFALFAQFLIRRYFLPRQKMLEAEGNLMRGYLQGRVAASVLSALAEQSEGYYEDFYGKREKILSTDRLAFMKKWMQVQRDSGIKTRGSGLSIRPDGGNKAHM